MIGKWIVSFYLFFSSVPGILKIIKNSMILNFEHWSLFSRLYLWHTDVFGRAEKPHCHSGKGCNLHLQCNKSRRPQGKKNIHFWLSDLVMPQTLPYQVAWIKSDSKAILAIHDHVITNNGRLQARKFGRLYHKN